MSMLLRAQVFNILNWFIKKQLSIVVQLLYREA